MQLMETASRIDWGGKDANEGHLMPLINLNRQML